MTTRKNTPKTRPAATRSMAAAAEKVRALLGLDTLETRKRDALDFHSVSVESIRAAINIAFSAGYDAGFKDGSMLGK